jgi:hypothetical protein
VSVVVEISAIEENITTRQLIPFLFRFVFNSRAEKILSRQMPARTTLRAGYAVVAIRIQEAMDDLTSNDVRGRLSDAVRDATKDTGNWAYYIDHTGDDESGDVYYSCGGDVMCSPYEMSKQGDSAPKAVVHHDAGMKVVPRTIYEPEADDADSYATMSESAKLYTKALLYERFISKDERDAADSSDFAGKGKSFPILKPGDVSAAAHALGRAGSANSSISTIKSNIIAIAKRKGWTKYLPKAWQAGGSSESARREAAKLGNTTGLRLVESAGCSFIGDVPIREAARTSYPIKIISPGTGSSAHYPADVLKKAAESGAFKRGTFMFWNHPTDAQERERPEGDLNNLAAITTTDGEYRETGAKGPGIYAEAKVMADYADKIEQRAPHIGLSIRAGGTSSGKTVDGKPVLASIDHVESVDYVARAGRGGMALAESAKFARLLESFNSNEGGLSDMDAVEVTKLKETVASQNAVIEGLRKRALRADALELAGAVLATTSLNEAQRKYVAESVIAQEIPVKDGALDAAKLTEAVNAAAKAYSATLPSTGVRGMGPGPTLVQESVEVKAAREAELKESQARQVRALMDLGLDEKAAKESAGVAA